jgi:hypothetical protein
MRGSKDFAKLASRFITTSWYLLNEKVHVSSQQDSTTERRRLADNDRQAGSTNGYVGSEKERKKYGHSCRNFSALRKFSISCGELDMIAF